MEYLYPTILRRYLSTFIDGVLVLMVMLIAPYVFQDDGGLSAHIRGFTGVFVLFIYEPLCTSLGCTLGQKITGIRIRKHFLHAKISLPAAYLRTFLKVTLGFISFLTILFSRDKRAIHDFAAGSIVVYSKLEGTLHPGEQDRALAGDFKGKPVTHSFGEGLEMKRVLRIFIIAEIVSVSLGIIIDKLLEKTLPREIQEYAARSEMADITDMQILAVGIMVFLLALLVVAWVGLWKLWRPARLLYTLCWLCGLLISCFAEPVVYYTPLGAVFSEIGTLSAGVILGVIYLSELKINFAKASTEQQLAPDETTHG